MPRRQRIAPSNEENSTPPTPSSPIALNYGLKGMKIGSKPS